MNNVDVQSNPNEMVRISRVDQSPLARHVAETPQDQLVTFVEKLDGFLHTKNASTASNNSKTYVIKYNKYIYIHPQNAKCNGQKYIYSFYEYIEAWIAIFVSLYKFKLSDVLPIPSLP